MSAAAVRATTAIFELRCTQAGRLCGAGIRACVHLRRGCGSSAAAARAQLAAEDEHGGAAQHLLAPVHRVRGQSELLTPRPISCVRICISLFCFAALSLYLRPPSTGIIPALPVLFAVTAATVTTACHQGDLLSDSVYVVQWASVDAAGPSTDGKEGMFRRLWSLKEVWCFPFCIIICSSACQRQSPANLLAIITLSSSRHVT